MGCGNSTATSAAAGRGKWGCGAWVPRERRRRGARSSLGPSSISSLELACFWKDREEAGAPVRGRSRPDSAGRTVAWVLQLVSASFWGEEFPRRVSGPSHPLSIGLHPGLTPDPLAPSPCAWKSAAEQIRTFSGGGAGCQWVGDSSLQGSKRIRVGLLTRPAAR